MYSSSYNSIKFKIACSYIKTYETEKQSNQATEIMTNLRMPLLPVIASIHIKTIILLSKIYFLKIQSFI